MKKMVLSTITFIVVFFGWEMYNTHLESVENRVLSLHPRVQKQIREYAEMTSKLKVGDLVLVRNLDNLESGRHLVVAEVYGNRISLEGRYDTEETLFLESGLENGIYYTSKYAFYPVYQESNPAEFQLVANWFWIQ